jgi:transcriptional regulator of acetoin/glycerol metabolism
VNSATLAHPLPVADLIGRVKAESDDIGAAERAVLHRALARSGGNVSKAAKNLNLSRATFYRKINQLGLTL